MPSELIEFPPDPDAQSTSRRGAPPPEEFVATDLLDGPEPSPPRGLMKKQRHISFWLAIALLLGALIALMLVSIASG